MIKIDCESNLEIKDEEMIAARLLKKNILFLDRYKEIRVLKTSTKKAKNARYTTCVFSDFSRSPRKSKNFAVRSPIGWLLDPEITLDPNKPNITTPIKSKAPNNTCMSITI
jgi:DNA-binding transcriptional regulator WhiA